MKLNSFVLTPVSLEVVPIDGVLVVIFDPQEALDNPDAPDVIAEVARGLAAARGSAIKFTGEDVRAKAKNALAEDAFGTQVMIASKPIAQARG